MRADPEEQSGLISNQTNVNGGKEPGGNHVPKTNSTASSQSGPHRQQLAQAVLNCLPCSRRRLFAYSVLFFLALLVFAFNSGSVRDRVNKSLNNHGEADNEVEEENYLLNESDEEPVDPEVQEEIEEEEEGEKLSAPILQKNKSNNKPKQPPQDEDEHVDDKQDDDEEKEDKEEGEDDSEEEGEEGVDPEKVSAKDEVLTLQYFADQCKELKAKKDTLDKVSYQVAAADCGWGYDFENSPAKTKPWKVYYFGSGWRPEIIGLSGCPMHCPNSPKCKIEKKSHLTDLGDADVVVVFQSDANSYANRLHGKKQDGSRQYHVVYWREAVFSSPLLATQKKFDFEMGVHYYSGILNPNFLRRPGQYLSGAVYPYPPIEFVPVEEREKFAISIISHCGANSQRDVYIDRLQSILGSSKVDRFGTCSGRKLPGKSINMAFKIMSRYKFYLSFENTIEDGYVTEKLFFVLNVPVLPVYLGALNVPNITLTPSFIRVSDFHSPKELADYLLYLDANPAEYMKYHEWRKNPAGFDPEYLEILQKRVAGPDELIYFKDKGFKRFPRTAQCCRLCDENYVKFAAESRTQKSLVGHMMSPSDIEKRFFKGSLG